MSQTLCIGCLGQGFLGELSPNLGKRDVGEMQNDPTRINLIAEQSELCVGDIESGTAVDFRVEENMAGPQRLGRFSGRRAQAAAMSVWLKSVPLKRRGSPIAFASA